MRRISTLIRSARQIPPVARTKVHVRQGSFTTINDAEIEHFSALSSQWWDPAGEFKLLHRMNPIRVQYIRDKVALDTIDEPRWTFATRNVEVQRGVGRWLEGKRCLDVGCGGGLLSEVSSLT